MLRFMSYGGFDSEQGVSGTLAGGVTDSVCRSKCVNYEFRTKAVVNSKDAVWVSTAQTPQTPHTFESISTHCTFRDLSSNFCSPHV